MRFGKRTAFYWEFLFKKEGKRLGRRRRFEKEKQMGERNKRETENTNIWSQETLEYETSLSDEDLKNLAGGLALAEYLSIPAEAIVSDRNFWAGGLGGRHLEPARNGAEQSERIRPALGWLCQTLRPAVAFSSAAAFCGIVALLFVLIAHLVEVHFWNLL
jgi:hypothetical protein